MSARAAARLRSDAALQSGDGDSSKVMANMPEQDSGAGGPAASETLLDHELLGILQLASTFDHGLRCARARCRARTERRARAARVVSASWPYANLGDPQSAQHDTNHASGTIFI